MVVLVLVVVVVAVVVVVVMFGHGATLGASGEERQRRPRGRVF
jgi:hypothetical protein